MKKDIALVILLNLTSILNAQFHWQRTNGPNGGIVRSLAVTQADHILAGTDYGLYRWTNQSNKWTEILETGIQAILVKPNGDIIVSSESGLIMSTNNGRSWINLNYQSKVYSLAINSKGYLFFVDDYSVRRSTDNGNSWHILSLFNKKPFCLVVDSADNIYCGVAYFGVYVSTDDGVTWTQKWQGYNAIWRLAIGPGAKIYAGSRGDGVFYSSNGGNSWTQINQGLTNKEISSIISDSSGCIYAATSGGLVFRLPNNGNSWAKIDSGRIFTSVLSLAVDQMNNIYCGIHSAGVYRLSSDGISWQEMNDGMKNSTIFALGINSGGHIFAGYNPRGIYRTTDGGDNWKRLSLESEKPFTKIWNIKVNSRGDIFTGTTYSFYRSTDNGESWEMTSLKKGNVFSLLINTNDYIFAGTSDSGVFRSTDNGNTWATANSGLTSLNILSFASNPVGDIYVGTPSGLYCSKNNGELWTNTGLTLTYVELIAINPNGHIFAANYNSIYRSTDNGINWTKIFLSSNNSINSLVINSVGYIFQVTSADRVLCSVDNGVNWIPVNTGLTTLALNELLVDASDRLFVSTNGGGVYRSVNQITGAVQEKNPPTPFALHQNFPNPFGKAILSDNSITKIHYEIPKDCRVQLTIYDILGREISTLVNEDKPPGEYEVEFNAAGLPSGVYVYRLTAGRNVETKKMILIR